MLNLFLSVIPMITPRITIKDLDIHKKKTNFPASATYVKHEINATSSKNELSLRFYPLGIKLVCSLL